MLTVEKMIDDMEKCGIKVYKVQKFNRETVSLEYDVFLQLIEEMGVKYVFYTLQYYEEGECKISEEYLDWEYLRNEMDISPKILLRFSDEINEYNQKLAQVDFDIPTEITMYCIHDDIAFRSYVDNRSQMLAGEPLMNNDDKLLEIARCRMEDIKDVIQEEQQEIEDLRNELKEIILEDPEFEKCTNKDIRYRYLMRLYTKLDERFEPLIGYDAHNKNMYRLDSVFIDEVWNEFRMRRRGW